MVKKNFRVFLMVAVLLFAVTVGSFASEVPIGTWVDEVVIVLEESAATAITRLQVGDIDVYANTLPDPVIFQMVRNDPTLGYYSAFGSYSEITFNTVGPNFNDGRLNPFNNRRIREAMNILVDREYVAQEVYGGLAAPKLTILNSVFADYARVVEDIKLLETKYAPNQERAEEIISEEMVAMGAERVNGVWHYDGSPVVLTFVIRNEDEQRQGLGDYVASQLEKIGFTVERLYRNSAQASPIWLQSDPWEGQWNLYTGLWGSPVVYRDQGHNFNQMYTDRVMSYPPFQALTPIPELEHLAEVLANKDFTSIEERAEAYGRALELSLQDSPRIFMVDVLGFVPKRAEISVASDLAGQLTGTTLWASTLRRGEEVGGRVTIAIPSVLVNPWNPIAGSNMTWDQFPIRATMDRGITVDPFTGNYWPNRIERAEVYVREGLPVEESLGWVDLEFVEEIVVPEDAWASWDPVEQRFITVAERFPEGVTVERMSRVYFPADFFEKAKWHDGSPVSIGDILFWFIIEFDRGMEGSPIFDESKKSDVQSTLQSFRGFRIVSEDPLVYEWYSNSWALDAEMNVTDLFPLDPNYGKSPWHTLALGMLAEMNEELAFSQDKARKIGAEWLGFQGGPSLPILAKYLEQAIEEGYIPYENALGKYISKEEALTRYNNAKAWYNDKEHFWIGDGPMYLEKAYAVESTIHLKRNPLYSEPADKWSMFDEPRIAEVAVSGPARVNRGKEASFEVEVTFKDEPYKLEHMKEVKFLILDSRGNLITTGMGEPVEDGLFKINLTPEITAQLPIGSNTLDVIAVPLLVGGASFGHINFVTLP